MPIINMVYKKKKWWKINLANATQSSVLSAWWELWWVYSFDANWLYRGSTAIDTNPTIYKTIDFSGASSIKLTTYSYIGTSWWIYFGLTNNVNWWVWKWNPKLVCFATDAIWFYGYNNVSAPKGWQTVVADINLLTWDTTITEWSATVSHTFTEISTVKTNCNMIWFSIDASTDNRIKTVEIEIS